MVVIGLLSLIVLLCVVIIVILLTLCRQKINNTENEYYTDYRHKNLILRIYKAEFEYQAVGNIERGKILDQGVFSKVYLWTLIEL